MSSLYFNCRSGVSGDMVVGSLLDLGISAEYLSAELGKTGLEGYSIDAKGVSKSGVRATKFTVVQEAVQPSRHLPEIHRIIDESALPLAVKDLGKEIFWQLASAEATVHKTSPDKVHFHEVGALDSIIDIVSAAILLTELDVRYASCSTISLGGGRTRAVHGLIEIPSPAVRHLLKCMPTTRTGIKEELTTPTGAAIIKAIVNEYTDTIPDTDRKGYGAGTKDLEIPNVLEARLII